MRVIPFVPQIFVPVDRYNPTTDIAKRQVMCPAIVSLNQFTAFVIRVQGQIMQHPPSQLNFGFEYSAVKEL